MNDDREISIQCWNADHADCLRFGLIALVRVTIE